MKKFNGIGESTVRLFKKRYLSECEAAGSSEVPVTSLPAKKKGRKLMLGEELDEQVKKYVKFLRANGTSIGTNVIMAAAEGIVRAHDRTLLAEYGGHMSFTKTWALSLLQRMGYVKRKASTKSTPGMSEERFLEIKSFKFQAL